MVNAYYKELKDLRNKKLLLSKTITKQVEYFHENIASKGKDLNQPLKELISRTIKQMMRMFSNANNLTISSTKETD